MIGSSLNGGSSNGGSTTTQTTTTTTNFSGTGGANLLGSGDFETEVFTSGQNVDQSIFTAEGQTSEDLVSS